LQLEELLSPGSPGTPDCVKAQMESSYLRTGQAQPEKEEAETQKLRQASQEGIIDGEAAEAIAVAKVNAGLLRLHVQSAMPLREEDGADQEGAARYQNDGSAMTAADPAAEMRRDSEFTGLFEGSVSMGSGAPGICSKGTGGSGGIVPSYSLGNWLLKMANAQPDERTELLKDKARGRITVRE
jgi:hypothetical protein